MRIAVVTLFPEMFAAVSEFGITARAVNSGLVGLTCWNPRDYTLDRHRTVDDKPFGGGPGMLMKTAPLQAAIDAARLAVGQGHDNGTATGARRVIYLSPQGRRLDQAGVTELAALDELVLVCGRYQGIDERVLDSEIEEEWSIGDFVISGGELAAMVVIDAVTRLQPGALGSEECAELDSFSAGLLHCPQFTRPQSVAGRAVPEVLLGGDHEKIRRWRLKQSLGATWRKRPDLLDGKELDSEQQLLLREYIEEFEAARIKQSG
ncbi:MAG: tRNA (guanosine(37)-N1)-methyltransferase TrmD [Gammaproteobacteria bacterium]|nr:tRNA (guanosine(37)-N1)-methyltransferase TrmD [Pseudomonadales bacterium]MCP5346570.1 tRNA (guanosine(37)-N1)-methyltransferase TrmD [Pseudomonadales bacterium]